MDWSLKVKVEDDCSSINDIQNNNSTDCLSVKEEPNSDLEDDEQELDDSEKPFICGVCDLQFSQNEDLNDHMQIHREVQKKQQQASKCHELYPFHCLICEMGFPTLIDLRSHYYVHIREKPFACKLCDKKFPEIYLLACHIKTHSDSPKSFSCEFCKRNFTKKCDLIKHIMLVHKDNEPIFLCKKCNCKYITEQGYLNHIAKHNKPHVCKFCGDSFNCKTSLTVHLKTHNPVIRQKSVDKPVTEKYECATCSKGFSQRNQLILHLGSHHRTKHFKCEICNQKFLLAHRLKHHMLLVHHVMHDMQVLTQTKSSWKCVLCLKEFSKNFYLLQHMKTHTTYTPPNPLKPLNDSPPITEVNTDTPVTEINTDIPVTDKLETENLKNDSQIITVLDTGTTLITMTHSTDIATIKSKQNCLVKGNVVIENNFKSDFCKKASFRKNANGGRSATRYKQQQLECSFCDFKTLYKCSLDLHMKFHVKS